jgi:hypothetical protein
MRSLRPYQKIAIDYVMRALDRPQILLQYDSEAAQMLAMSRSLGDDRKPAGCE